MASWLGWGASVADEPIDKATSELLPAGSEDIALNLEICDQIRSKTIPAKDAARALKRRLNHKNPNVQLLTLGLTDVCIKNGGDHFLVEVASRDFIDNLVSILKMPGLNMDVKNKILREMQNWALAFEAKPLLHYVPQVYKDLKHEGFNFPPKDPLVTSSAMVDTKTAPDWIDSEVCLRCRTAFTFTNRKHHCRNCGQVFDQQCSSKSLPLPQFGITQEVRVCDGCYLKLTRQQTKPQSSDHKPHKHRQRSTREAEDAELQRAIQLSLQEIGAAGGSRPGYVPYQPSSPPWQPSEPPAIDRASHPAANRPAEEEDDPDLRAAIEASLREAQAPKASAPTGMETPRASAVPFEYSQGSAAPALPSVPALPNYDLEPLESDAILTFNQTVEQIQAQNRPDVARYPAVNELYNKAASLSPKVTRSIDDTTRRAELLDDMHNKLSEAVKLYDQLLTQRVSQPAWRSQAAHGSAPYQQQAATGYQPGYTQWQPAVASQAPEAPYTSQLIQSPAAPSAYQPQMYAQHPAPVSAYPLEPGTNPMGYQTYAAPVSLPQSPGTTSGPVSIPQHAAFAPPPLAPAIAPSQSPVQAFVPPPRAAVASPPPSVQHPPAQAHYLPAQQTYAPTAPALPNFPAAPTLPPTLFSLSAPNGIPAQNAQPDQKEALLIDL